MTTLQIRAHLPERGETDLLATPPLAEARAILEGDGPDFPGNKSYSLGGAILLPYANRIPGALSPDGKTVETEILGRPVRLPANAQAKKPGGQRYAMHGLILASRVDGMHRRTTEDEDAVQATLDAGDFRQHWRSRTEISFENVLRSDSFTLSVTARNVGDEPLPLGIGWHPYFLLPSGHRAQARLRLPARRRTEVDDYANVLPTGRILPVAGTPYDFTAPGGRALGDLYLDDCFTDLERSPGGEAIAEVVDPEAAYGLRVIAVSPHIRAIQVYAPPEKGFVVIEPQFNLADPFGPEWGPDVDTGMVLLEPGGSVTYSARLELFVP
jgi:galactose mutarotase-like enzyme